MARRLHTTAAGGSALNYRFYYCDFTRDIEMPADGARTATVDEIAEIMSEVLREPGNYLGVFDSAGELLQFLVGDDGAIGVEFPDVERRGHYGRRASLAECLQILRNAGEAFHCGDVSGLAFEKW
jgi:hypothetical protein